MNELVNALNILSNLQPNKQETPTLNYPWQLPKVIRLSHSTLSSLHSCPRKFEFAKLYQHPRERENINTGSGHAIHEGYQEWLISRDADRAFFKLALHYPLHIESNPNHVKSLEACYATLENMMMNNALLEYDLATVELPDGSIKPAIEVPFQINVHHPSWVDDGIIFIYVGKIDFIYFSKLTGQHIVVDIKSHRDRWDDRTVNYEFSDQMLPYALVLQTLLGKNIGSLSVKYFDVKVDIIEPKTQIYEFDKTQDDVDDWAKSLYYDIERIKQFIRLGWFQRNGNSCRAFNNICHYFHACKSRDPEFIQKEILGINEPYVEEPWKPWITVELDLAA